ncbi:LapA family protein [Desulfobotulus sp.]|uniref:LapA family protein n=1 Tax=Desulfobotulus sp. TaxID=1940337 RepID=UPI002A371854|nr:LapA family protein [Desulfobotulus sp.]MDY0162963.1 LapA family protein [Desulfobotulus sp.]
MKRIKLTLTLLTLGLIALLFYQNQAYFLQPHVLSLNFYFFQYDFPETPTGIYWVLCFSAGFLLMFFSSIALRLRAAARIRMLHNENLEHLETIEALQNELESMASPESDPEDSEDHRAASGGQRREHTA